MDIFRKRQRKLLEGAFMKKLFKVFGIIALAAVIGFSMTACEEDVDGDNNDGGSWNSGKSLKGTSWEVKDTYSSGGIISSKHDYTTTITFTSDDMLTITKTGWYETTITRYDRNYQPYYETNRKDVNESYNVTYTYFTNTKEGYMNSNFFSINPWNFKVLSDDRTMAGKLDSTQFTRK